MTKSDDGAEPPNRPLVLLSRHVCSSVVRMSRNDSPLPRRRERAPILSQARVAWDLDEADTSLFWSLGIPSVRHQSAHVPGAQEVADLGSGG